MSNKSNDEGRAYEFICLITLQKEILNYRSAEIVENSSFHAALRAWNTVGVDIQKILETSAKAVVTTLFDLEPLMIEDDSDKLQLYIQSDSRGEEGDVRDIIVYRSDIQWEIGLSIKHNHFAVKHSRLAKSLDFGNKWFGRSCSQSYWNAIEPIFTYLTEEKRARKKWSELPNKENDVYVPLLQAFIDEVKRATSQDKTIPQKMVEYLLSEFDFYKVISVDRKNLTQIQSYNLHGTLNKPGRKSKPKIIVPETALPTRIVNMDFKPGSNNTVELYMDGGWQFSFRIHNAATLVETSLKFDIQIVGMPTTILMIECAWH